MLLTFIILGVTIALLLWNKLPMEVPALLSMMALVLAECIELNTALAGFANPTVITIAALFVVGGGLFRTGVADWLANHLIALSGESVWRFLVVLGLLTAVFSAFLSNTGTVAVLLPSVVSASRRLQVPAGTLLLPMAFSAQLGGLLTLIGTPPNIILSDALENAGFAPFSFFEFSLLGFPLLGLYLVYSLTLGRWLVPKRGQSGEDGQLSIWELARSYEVQDKLFKLVVDYGSPLVGKTLAEADLSRRYRVHVIHLKEPRSIGSGEESERGKQLEGHQVSTFRMIVGVLSNPEPMRENPTPGSLIKPGLRMIVQGDKDDVMRLARENGMKPGAPIAGEEGRGGSLAEVVIRQRSRISGRSIIDEQFGSKNRLQILGVMRNGAPLPVPFTDTPLAFGDTLLVYGSSEDIYQLGRDTRNYLLVGSPVQAGEGPLSAKAYAAIGILFLMVLLILFKVFPLVIVSLAAALAMILLGCLNTETAYRQINWQSLILIAAMIPMGSALQETGATELMATSLIERLGGAEPVYLLAGVFLMTMLLSQFISNTATAVLLAPVALEISGQMGVSPYPLLMMVAAGASSAFLTPIASPVNTLVLGPGNFRFGDYARVGLPLVFIILAASLYLVPLIWPMTAVP
ncbi:MAG: SLC13 family permease [Acidobacteriota bacterium]|nr:SLC13 family permease [Acidobacteriota bacterium]